MNSNIIVLMIHYLQYLITIGSCICSISCSNGEPIQQKPDGADQTKVKRSAELIFVEGTVRLKRSGGSEWENASLGMKLAINDKVRTQRESFATIEFEEGGVLRIEPESLVAVTDLRIESKTQARRSTFTLEEGTVEAEMNALEKKGSEFRVKTPSAEASVIHREVAFQ